MAADKCSTKKLDLLRSVLFYILFSLCISGAYFKPGREHFLYFPLSDQRERGAAESPGVRLWLWQAAACSTHQANLLKEEGPRAMRAWFCHFCVTALARCFDESEALLADGEVSMGESVIRFGGALTFGPPRI